MGEGRVLLDSGETLQGRLTMDRIPLTPPPKLQVAQEHMPGIPFFIGTLLAGLAGVLSRGHHVEWDLGHQLSWIIMLNTGKYSLGLAGVDQWVGHHPRHGRVARLIRGQEHKLNP